MKRATFAGSWYPEETADLEKLVKAETSQTPQKKQKIKAIIGPHAGYKYCGPTMGSVYAKIDTHGIDTVFLLGVYRSK